MWILFATCICVVIAFKQKVSKESYKNIKNEFVLSPHVSAFESDMLYSKSFAYIVPTLYSLAQAECDVN